MEVNFRPNLVSSWLGWITPATELENELSSPALALFPLSLRLATSGRLLLCPNQYFILQSPFCSANNFSNGNALRKRCLETGSVNSVANRTGTGLFNLSNLMKEAMSLFTLRFTLARVAKICKYSQELCGLPLRHSQFCLWSHCGFHCSYSECTGPSKHRKSRKIA